VLSPKPWKLEAVLFLALGVFLCLFAGTLVAWLLGGTAETTAPATLPRIVLSAICFQGASIVLVAWFIRAHQIGWGQAFGLNNYQLRATVLGALVICCFMPVGQVLQQGSKIVLERMGIRPLTQEAVVALRDVGHGPGLVAFAVITIIVAPLAEELLFRGVLYPAIKQAGFPRLALWGSSAAFAGIHLNLPIFLPLMVLALVLVWLYEKTDNLLAPIVAHALFNAANLVMFFTFPSMVRES
jgi:CAAX protease family protein